MGKKNRASNHKKQANKWKHKTESEKDKEFEDSCMRYLKPMFLLFTLFSPVVALSSTVIDWCSRSSMDNVIVTTSGSNQLVSVITGATDVHGMGYALTCKLVDSGWSVILGGRNRTKTDQVAMLLGERLQKKDENDNNNNQHTKKQYIETFNLQLHDLASVRKFTQQTVTRTSTTGVNLYVDVAGESGTHNACTDTEADGNEHLMQVNAISKHVLLENLLPSLRDGANTARDLEEITWGSSRVVTVVSSIGNGLYDNDKGKRRGGAKTNRKTCDPKSQYHTSKLLLSLNQHHVHTKLASSPISKGKIQFFTVDPGSTATNFQEKNVLRVAARGGFGMARLTNIGPLRLIRWLLSSVSGVIPDLRRSAEHAALGLYHVATSSDLNRSISGLHFQDTYDSFVDCERRREGRSSSSNKGGGRGRSMLPCGATKLEEAVRGVSGLSGGGSGGGGSGGGRRSSTFDRACLEVFNFMKASSK